MRHEFICLVLLLLPALSLAAEPAQSPAKHLGVASCASSVCHGKLGTQSGSEPALNQYRIWSQQDYHSRAYRDLSNSLSQSIVAKLGLPSAAAAKICLDCHTDNVPKSQQGPKFQLTDGVGCEACHGGAEVWITTHAQNAVTHSDNLARGMYPNENPRRRAQLCLTCHMGTQDKFVNHVLIGAGHPRLRFELQVFTFNQPRHFHVDARYIQRKGDIQDMNLWVTGQIEGAQRYLELLQSDLMTPPGLLPEFAFYECFSCHHPLDKPRWSSVRAGPGVKPGTLRLQKNHLIMLQAITEAIAPASSAELTADVDSLIVSGQADVATLRRAAQKLYAWIETHADWTRRAYTRADMAKVRSTLLRYAAEDRTSDFGAAEQLVMAVESLSYAMDDHEHVKSALDSLYNGVRSSSTFDPSQFAALARSLQGQL
jgi:hypothetical protein